MDSILASIIFGAGGGGGGGGTDSYTDLTDKPKINGVELNGNKSLSNLGLYSKSEVDDLVAEIELFKFPNAVIHGAPNINNGQVSDFSNANYLVFPSVFNLSGRGFEFKFAFTTKDDITVPQNILGGKFCMALFIQNGKLNLRVSSNGTSWDIVNLEGTATIEANKTYYVKINFTRLNYVLSLSTDDETYNEIGSVSTGDISPHPAEIYIGVGNNFNNPFKGIINLNKCYLKVNQSIIWQGMDDAGLATRLATDLDNIDAEGIEAIKEIVGVNENYRLTRPINVIEADGTLEDCNHIGEWQVVKAADAKTITDSPFTASGYRITVESRYGTDTAPTLRQIAVNNFGERAERDLNASGVPISGWRYSPSYKTEAELKMLGWNVPKNFPIQNEVSGNTFTQRVGRIDLGSLDWVYEVVFKQNTYNCKPADESKKANIYCAKYNTESNNDVFNRRVTGISINDLGNIRVNDPTYTDVNTFKTAMKGQYLYYELETPVTKQIDGNEVIEKDAVTAKVNNFVKPTSDAEILALPNGIYSINVDDTSLFPCRWGTLIVLKSGYVYGSMIFIGTDASYWFRNISSGAWRETWWQKLAVADWKMMAETQSSNTMEFPLANLPSGIFFQGVLTNNTEEYGADYVSFCKDQTNGISVITPFKDTDRAISYDSSTKTIKVTGTGYYRRFYVKAM